MKQTICVVGLGYVGLPLAHALARGGHATIGFDVNSERIAELQEGIDRTNELTTSDLQSVEIEYSDNPEVIARASIIIVAVPTPIDDQNKPDLTILKSAAKTVGQNIQKGAIAVFESTVYPGTTEEICGAIIEEQSGLTSGKDFTLGYSPERINPGDKKNTIDKIIKVVAGQNETTLNTLLELYGSIIHAGVHAAPNIKVAEMAKAIENAQRDLNIAFVNEVALFCHRLGIRTKDVLEAAGTKWNFLAFQPGLVGGHCIGVDPYYLVEKADQMGMKTHVITAGRSINDSMSRHVVNQVLDALPVPMQEARVLVMGVTFKENVPDTRNSKVFDVISQLQSLGATVLVNDPQVGETEITRRGLAHATLADGPYHAVMLMVPHGEYKELTVDVLRDALHEGGVLYDLKSMLEPTLFDSSTQTYLSL